MPFVRFNWLKETKQNKNNNKCGNISIYIEKEKWKKEDDILVK